MANTFRIRKLVPASNAAPTAAISFEPQFSQDDGTTWAPLNEIPYPSLTHAVQAILNVVNNEASFNAQVLSGDLVPAQTFISYPIVS